MEQDKKHAIAPMPCCFLPSSLIPRYPWPIRWISLNMHGLMVISLLSWMPLLPLMRAEVCKYWLHKFHPHQFWTDTSLFCNLADICTLPECFTQSTYFNQVYDDNCWCDTKRNFVPFGIRLYEREVQHQWLLSAAFQAGTTWPEQHHHRSWINGTLRWQSCSFSYNQGF